MSNPTDTIDENVKKSGLSEEEKHKIFMEEFFPHADALYNFAYHLTYKEDDAADLVQDTFMKSIKFVESYHLGTNARAWLFRILKNSFINEYRKKSKRPYQVDIDDATTYYNQESTQVDMRKEIFDGILADELVTALDSLPVDFRTVVILCDVEGFTYEEMSKILDIPIGTVRSRLHRARHMLKDKLYDYATHMGYETEKKSKGQKEKKIVDE